MPQKGQEKSPRMALERRKTLTMSWEGLGDIDDDERFFESFERLSSAVSLDLASSGSEDEYDDSRMSFASAMSALPAKSAMSPARTEDLSVPKGTSIFGETNEKNIFGDYNMWMSEPGSIKERRRRLFQDMGLSSNKNLSVTGTKLGKADPKEVASENKQQKVKKDDVSIKASTEQKSVSKSVPKMAKEEQKNVIDTPPTEVVLVRSRSDGDIDTCSAHTKMRKEDLVGPISKQRLTRTSSTLQTPQAGIYQYANTMRKSQNKIRERDVMNDGGAMSSMMSDVSSFFLIKDLDSGKEFIVKEFNNDGMWNRLSDVQTGKQLTMEEFEKSVGYSPVVKELMRRENVSRALEDERKIGANSYFGKSFRNSKRKGVALLKNIKGVANSIMEKEKEQTNNHAEMEQQQQQRNNKNPNSKWIKVRQQGKTIKEFTALHLCQEIQAHEGSIWTMKFSPDAKYLASAGEDRVVHVWEVQECEVMKPADEYNLSTSASTPDHPNLGDVAPLPSEKGKERSPLAELPPMLSEWKKKGKASNKKKGNLMPDYVYVPETVFSLSEKPVCSFTGHLDDVLDLSWSKTQLLLSASMDKTVRLWDMETKSCLKLFAHNDYVTCIQFNPIDDNYFISGSLDAKVRIWSIPDRQLVDYTDLHEMVTAARYTPDGQGALIGSHKGGYRLYSTADCCLEQKDQIELHRKNKEAKKVTGFEFAPGNPSEVLVTSADSRIRIVDGSDVTHKFRGFRNTSSQISASFSANGKYVVSASEDSQVYIWKREEIRNSGTGKSKGMITTFAHEHFQCKDVSVATPWPGSIKHDPPIVEVHSKRQSKRFISHQNLFGASPSRDDNTLGTSSRQMLPPLPKKTSAIDEDHPHSSQNLEDGITSKRHPPRHPKNKANLDEEPTQKHLPSHQKKNSAHDEHSNYPDEDYTQASCADTGEKSKRHMAAKKNCAPEKVTSGMEEDPTRKKKVANLDKSTSCHEEDPSRVTRTDSELGIGDSFSDPSSIGYNDPASISASSNSASQSWSSYWSVVEGNHSTGGQTFQATAWGMVIVTAGLGGEIRAYQNLGLPVKVGTNLF